MSDSIYYCPNCETNVECHLSRKCLGKPTNQPTNQPTTMKIQTNAKRKTIAETAILMEDMKAWMSQLPEDAMQGWRIKHFKVNSKEADMFNLRNRINAISSDRDILPGKYCKLEFKDDQGKWHVMMSDTFAEFIDHSELFDECRKRGGHVLINGLGMGCAASVIANMDNVLSVTVIEREPEVIRMVADFMDEKISIIEEDAFNAIDLMIDEDGLKYSVVWHDIWPDISPCNLPDMNILEGAYKDHCHWQGSWCRTTCEWMDHVEKEMENI